MERRTLFSKNLKEANSSNGHDNLFWVNQIANIFFLLLTSLFCREFAYNVNMTKWKSNYITYGNERGEYIYKTNGNHCINK